MTSFIVARSTGNTRVFINTAKIVTVHEATETECTVEMDGGATIYVAMSVKDLLQEISMEEARE